MSVTAARWGRRPVFAALIIAASAGCAPKPFTEPEIVAGSERTVSVASGRLRSTEAVAERFCAGFGRRAVYQGRAPLSGDDITDIYYYECVDDR